MSISSLLKVLMSMVAPSPFSRARTGLQPLRRSRLQSTLLALQLGRKNFLFQPHFDIPNSQLTVRTLFYNYALMLRTIKHYFSVFTISQKFGFLSMTHIYLTLKFVITGWSRLQKLFSWGFRVLFPRDSLRFDLNTSS